MPGDKEYHYFPNLSNAWHVGLPNRGLGCRELRRDVCVFRISGRWKGIVLAGQMKSQRKNGKEEEETEDIEEEKSKDTEEERRKEVKL